METEEMFQRGLIAQGLPRLCEGRDDWRDGASAIGGDSRRVLSAEMPPCTGHVGCILGSSDEQVKAEPYMYE